MTTRTHSKHRKTSSHDIKEMNEAKEFLQLNTIGWRRPYVTKAQRKAIRTGEKQDKLTASEKSEKSNKLLAGYIRIMNFLSRGCDVKAA